MVQHRYFYKLHIQWYNYNMIIIDILSLCLSILLMVSLLYNKLIWIIEFWIRNDLFVYLDHRYEFKMYQIVLGYWVHRIFHFRFLYKHVHSVHHSFREPTAFGYCATHPLEGISEVNTVLHLAELIIPIHPLMTLFFFEYITVNEMMGHDGG